MRIQYGLCPPPPDKNKDIERFERFQKLPLLLGNFKSPGDKQAWNYKDLHLLGLGVFFEKGSGKDSCDTTLFELAVLSRNPYKVLSLSHHVLLCKQKQMTELCGCARVCVVCMGHVCESLGSPQALLGLEAPVPGHVLCLSGGF